MKRACVVTNEETSSSYTAFSLDDICYLKRSDEVLILDRTDSTEGKRERKISIRGNCWKEEFFIEPKIVLERCVEDITYEEWEDDLYTGLLSSNGVGLFIKEEWGTGRKYIVHYCCFGE
jgi:hypothetical protein